MNFMQAKAFDLFHAYTENLVPPGGGTLVTARYENEDASPCYRIADFSSIDSIDCRSEGLEFSARGRNLAARFEPGDNGPRLEIEETPFSGPGALLVRVPRGRDFAFLFPRPATAASPVRLFLEKTFIEESRLTPPAAEAAVERILARLTRPEEGNP